MDQPVKAKLDKFFKSYPARKWPAEQIIIQAHDEPQGVYLIESGQLIQYDIDYRGNKLVVNVYKDYAFIPMVWALSGHDNKYFYETIEPTTLRCAPKADFLHFLKTNNDVAFDLLTRTYSGLNGVFTRMLHLMSSSAYVRVLHELIIQAKRQKPETTDQSIHLKLKEYELASYCGLSKETVSREFNKLKERDLASVDGTEITIHNLKNLEAELEKKL